MDAVLITIVAGIILVTATFSGEDSSGHGGRYFCPSLEEQLNMNYEEERRRYLSFCGAYCKTCYWFTGEIKRKAKGLLDIAQEQNCFPRLFKDKVDPENFLKGLELLSQTHTCSGCKLERRERCEIVRCALEKGVENCGECKEFPCEILKNNPGVVKFHTIENLKEIKRIGFEKWVEGLSLPPI